MHPPPTAPHRFATATRSRPRLWVRWGLRFSDVSPRRCTHATQRERKWELQGCVCVRARARRHAPTPPNKSHAVALTPPTPPTTPHRLHMPPLSRSRPLFSLFLSLWVCARARGEATDHAAASISPQPFALASHTHTHVLAAPILSYTHTCSLRLPARRSFLCRIKLALPVTTTVPFHHS